MLGWKQLDFHHMLMRQQQNVVMLMMLWCCWKGPEVGKTHDELFEVDLPIAVFVEDVDHSPANNHCVPLINVNHISNITYLLCQQFSCVFFCHRDNHHHNLSFFSTSLCYSEIATKGKLQHLCVIIFCRQFVTNKLQ